MFAVSSDVNCNENAKFQSLKWHDYGTSDEDFDVRNADDVSSIKLLLSDDESVSDVRGWDCRPARATCRQFLIVLYVTVHS